jgi:hypothetical protein
LQTVRARGVPLAYVSRVEMETGAHRSIDIVVQQLVTDERFRRLFLRDPQQALMELLGRAHLTEEEIGALGATGSLLSESRSGAATRANSTTV